MDKFFHLLSGLLLNDVLRNRTRLSNIAKLRFSCRSFGPSGLKKAPKEGVAVGYTSRMSAPERHKSKVRPEALNSMLINVVHHFHLKSEFEFVNMDRGVMVINHYKYQVWEVFKEKFYRRVATSGSKDRATVLGTKAVEPPDWWTRFCEFNDNRREEHLGLPELSATLLLQEILYQAKKRLILLKGFGLRAHWVKPFQPGIYWAKPITIIFFRNYSRYADPLIERRLSKSSDRWDLPFPKSQDKILSTILFLFRPPETVSIAEFSDKSGMSPEEDMRRPQDRKSTRGQAGVTENGGIEETLFSPGFISVAVMAGWDEEALLIASLIVDDTPDRQFKHKKRTKGGFKTPPSNSRSGKRHRDQRRSPAPIPATVLDLGEDQQENKPDSHDMKEATGASNKVAEENKGVAESKVTSSASTMHGQGLPLPSLDRLREELSCAICLEVCFEPSTTACGHSFCRKCLKSAADKCGKRCPKCRQLNINGRSCSVNTVLWNTIQLLFPDEVESRKAAKANKIKASEELEFHSPELAGSNSTRRRSLRAAAVISRELYERRRAMPSIEEAPQFHVPERGETNNYRRPSLRSVAVSNRDLHERRRRPLPSQDEDAALALRLQRDEFMDAFRETRENSRTSTSLSMARTNLRALASRAINIRVRNQAI